MQYTRALLCCPTSKMADLDRRTFDVVLWAFCITYALGHGSPGPVQCCPEDDLLWQQGSVNRRPTRDFGMEALGLELSAIFVERSCPMTALFRANFTAVGDEGICMGGDLRGRRVLRMDMHIQRQSEEEDWIFEVAEEAASSPGLESPIVGTVLTGVRGSISLRLSQRCQSKRYLHFPDVRRPTLITVYLGHSFLKVDLDGHEYYTECWDCFWDLDSKSASAKNSLLIGINRRVRIDGLDTVGNGICDVRFRWLCPHCKGWRGDMELERTLELLSQV